MIFDWLCVNVDRSEVTCLHPKSPHLGGCELSGLAEEIGSSVIAYG